MSRVLVSLTSALLLLCSLAAAQTSSQPAAQASKFKEIEFLVGDWAADSGSGEPGKATAGEFSFRLELNGQVLVRHSFADYGKENRHEDLLYIYRNSPSEPLRAIYFDNEGHVIHYSVTASPNSAVFDSDPAQPGPRFRLTYQLAGKMLNGKFEMAMPGSTEYKTYLAWTSVKKG
jgi:hypothetical protein